MWEYKIIKSDLWWNLYKRKEENWKLSVRFLYWGNKRGLNKTYARIFYHREDAESALVIMRQRDGKESD